ncbi:IS3 family transposase [Streptomyces sp. NPDC048417]|uniref:IS3 family transposase n=1 Tax=Streptomyces sp. NPDC048417 TaxID=3155387 RepID=UPI003449F40F
MGERTSPDPGEVRRPLPRKRAPASPVPPAGARWPCRHRRHHGALRGFGGWAEDVPELIRNKGPWTSINDVESAVAEYVDWFNQRRLHGELGHLTPVEHEAAHYAAKPPASLQESQ